MKTATSRTALLTALLLAATAYADEPAKHFAHPDRIRYDGQCFTIDGQDTFIFSGAFHYFRTPKELWRERFQKIKDAHFNAVETYVPWNWSEREMPADLNDHSKTDLSDLKDWLKMAHEEFGLYTIIRPGPYICAEWLGGGLPQWLWTKQPAQTAGPSWLRTDDPTYLAWTKHWYDQVLPVIAAEQVTHKPKGAKGVILVQVENEYDFWGFASDASRTKHLQFLYDTAVADGIDVPLFTCWTRQVRGSHDPKLSQMFDTSNYYHRWGLNNTASNTQELIKKQPDAPAMVTELQGGWFADAGGQLSQDQAGIEPEQTNAITLTAIANGIKACNYYMLVGGSNFGTWGGGDILQSYDYYAPIRENGGTDRKYAVVQALGDFLAHNGPALARASAVPATLSPADPGVVVNVRAAADGQRFVFVRNTQQQNHSAKFQVQLADGTAIQIDHELPPRIAEVLHLPAGKTQATDGEWWCHPADAPKRPPVAPPVRIANALTRDDPGPTEWKPIADNTSLIRAGITDVADVVYRSHATLDAEQVEKFTALRARGADAAKMVLRVNGKLVQSHNAGQDAKFDLAGALHTGDNTFELLYENHGVPGFGEPMNKPPGVRGLQLLQRGAAGRPLENWRVCLLKDGQQPPVAIDADDSTWDKVVLNEQTFQELAAAKQPGHPPLTYPAAAILNDKNATAVYRTTVELSDQEVAAKPVRLDLQRIDNDGEIYVNGQHIGSSHDWRKPFVADVTALVHPGANVVAVVVTNSDADGGLTRPAQLYSNEDVLTLPMDVGTGFAGVTGQWWAAKDTSAWKPVTLDTTTPLSPTRTQAAPGEPSDTLTRWYRTTFTLPAAQPKVWAPWNAVIDASGEGMVYLNGHALGRFYHAGPQRQFYLPECWLNLKPGGENVLAVSLHPVGDGPALRGVEIRQSAEQAEYR